MNDFNKVLQACVNRSVHVHEPVTLTGYVGTLSYISRFGQHIYFFHMSSFSFNFTAEDVSEINFDKRGSCNIALKDNWKISWEHSNENHKTKTYRTGK